LELYHFGSVPAGGPEAPFVFAVRPGETMESISQRLHRERLIRNPVKFRLYARLTGKDRHVRAGEYALAPANPPSYILETFTFGRVILHKITIPEGYTLRQIAVLLAQNSLADRDAFMRAAFDPKTALRFGIDAATLEGYLFPETYHFPRPVSTETLLSTMVGTFRKAFLPRWEADAMAAGFTLHQIVTLASMIEKETGAPFERPLIASVFHNRLKKKMRLESDPTVIYGIDTFDGNLTKQHLARPTPYNTYRITGLPPGPISNPGAESLQAAVYPADTRYLYFVSKNDGTHRFSENIRAHGAAVRRYQKQKGVAP